MMATAEELRAAGSSYAANGFAVIPAFMSAAETARLKRRMARLLAAMDLETLRAQGNPFIAGTGQDRASDAYFLTSGDVVQPFFEACAETAVNKVGHALHVLDPVFRDALLDDKVAATLAALGMRAPMPVQSMYILKSARNGGEVAPHQDNTFLITTPTSVLGLWIALEDADVRNGCMWAVPGSHLTHPCARSFLRNADGTGTVFEPAQAPELPTAGAVPLEVKAGTLVALHGSLVHFSHANTSGQSRHAYTVHFVEHGLPWHPRNWLQSRLFAPLRDPSPCVPVLDVGALDAADAWALDALAFRFDVAMRRYGAAVLVNHGLDDGLIARLRAQAAAFFAQPEGAKARFAARGGYGADGYHGLAREAVGNVRAANPDAIESLYFDASRASQAPAMLRDALVAYVTAVDALSRRVYRLAERALGAADGAFASLGRDDFVKLSQYRGDGPVLYDAHTDYTGFTLLMPGEDAASALQVLVDGAWSDVRGPPRAVVVNAGDFVPNWSGGRWHSPLHRVVGRGDRLSIPFFTGPRADAVVRPLVDGGRSEFAPVVAGRWLDERRARSKV